MQPVDEFEAQRDRLRGLALRLLGNAADAEDAVQEAWLRLSSLDAAEIENPPAWLRTVLTRICLDVLRARRGSAQAYEDAVADVPAAEPSPEELALLADAVGNVVLVVLEALSPEERVAFVLHDMFSVPFDQIGPIVGRTPDTAKKLASRARQKVRGGAASTADTARKRRVVAAFLAAARAGDLDAVLAVLAPDVVRRADPAVLPVGVPVELRGAHAVARGTVAFAPRSRAAELALIDGEPGLVIASAGRVRLVVTFDVLDDRIAGYEVIADPRRLATVRITLAD